MRFHIWNFTCAATLCAAGILLAGCATQLSNADAARVNTIGFSGFDEPSYDLTGFFALSTLPADFKNHPDFADQMAQQNLHLGAEMKTVIAKALRSDGYEIVEDANGADAALNLELGGLYAGTIPAYSAGAGNYEPEYTAMATLRDVKTKKILFRRMYVYRDNSLAPMDGSVLIRPDPKYGFKKVMDVYANPQLAAEGFRAAEPLIAQSIGESLKKQ